MSITALIFQYNEIEGKEHRAENSTLVLHAKDPSTWKIIARGPRGMVSYNRVTGSFIFSAKGLVPLTAYSLVRYAGKTPDGDLIASGRTDKSGKLTMSGTWHKWSKKIWLVLSSDITVKGNHGSLKAWNPAQYLFEDHVLGKAVD